MFWLCLQLPSRGSQSEEAEEEEGGASEVASDLVTSGNSASGPAVKASSSTSQRGHKRSKKLDEALLEFFQRPRPSDALAKKVIWEFFFSIKIFFKSFLLEST